MDVNTVEVFQRVVEHMPMGFVMYNANHTVVVINKKIEDLFGVSRNDVVGKVFSIKDKQGSDLWFFTQVLFPSIAPRMEHISPAGEYPQIVRISFDDPRLELQTTTLQLADKNGSQIGFVKLIEDRTREATIMESKHEFVSIVSHQLRTPVTAVNWTFQLLLKDTLPDGLRDIAETGARAAAELVSRIDDTVEVAKIEDGRFDYKFQSVDLGVVLKEVVDRERLLAGQYNVAIQFDPPQEKYEITADQHKLSVALANIINNAFKYSNSNTEVAIELSKLPDRPYCAVSIRDQGIGISEEDRKNLFEKFFRAENARRVQPDGNGLGLFLAKNVIEYHGGSVEVASTLNQGSTFTVYIPTEKKLIPALKEGA